MTAPSITCVHCWRTSFNPNDIRHGYCGHCHAFFPDGVVCRDDLFGLKRIVETFRSTLYVMIMLESGDVFLPRKHIPTASIDQYMNLLKVTQQEISRLDVVQPIRAPEGW